MSDIKKKKVREPRKSSLRKLFDRIQHVRYAVISPYYQLPMENAGRLIILTDNFQAINNLWNLTRYSAESQYSTILSNNEELIVTVLEKGKNVFPETFESLILGRAVLHEDCVKVPDSDTWPVLRLFWKLIYEKFLGNEPHDRKMLIDWISLRTGIPIRTRYRWLSWNASPVPKE